jgi:DNA-binding winged helix-turn-helix (wHTH) protein
VIRYRFSDFTLSPQRRLLVRAGEEVPLIPRYFDLLVLLVERRHEAVHRREIFERVWADANVSDSALSQAVRTLRRTLGDDSSEPKFIRTVSRHGYRFVLAEVIEEEDDGIDAVAPARPLDLPATQPIAEAKPDAPLWTRAAAGGGVAGFVSGAVGGLILALAPGSAATAAIAPVLAVIGGVCGVVGGAGVGVGLSAGESRLPSNRAAGLVIGAAIGGGLVGTAVQWLARWGLGVLLGLNVDVGGTLAGLAIGAAAGAGYAVAISTTFTLPRSVLIMAGLCGLGGIVLNIAGYPLVGGTIHAIASAAEGSRATLAPLGRLMGEPDFGPVSGAIIAFGEAAAFGTGLALGLLRRRQSEAPASK